MLVFIIVLQCGVVFATDTKVLLIITLGIQNCYIYNINVYDAHWYLLNLAVCGCYITKKWERYNFI